MLPISELLIVRFGDSETLLEPMEIPCKSINELTIGYN